MRNLADFIEQYLRNVLIRQEKVELQRRELAKMFRCAPSQINYVLETRFTFEKGYLVESKRGGGGYIRITAVPWGTELNYTEQVETLIPDLLDEQKTESILRNLVEKGLIGSEEAQLCLELLKKYFSDLPVESADIIRAKLVKVILIVLGLKNK